MVLEWKQTPFWEAPWWSWSQGCWKCDTSFCVLLFCGCRCERWRCELCGHAGGASLSGQPVHAPTPRSGVPIQRGWGERTAGDVEQEGPPSVNLCEVLARKADDFPTNAHKVTPIVTKLWRFLPNYYKHIKKAMNKIRLILMFNAHSHFRIDTDFFTLF